MLKTKAEPAEQAEEIRQVPITELHPFKDHPFKVLDDEAMLKTVESVARFGLLTPLVVRPRQEGGYEIISGHRRQHAAQLRAKLARSCMAGLQENLWRKRRATMPGIFSAISASPT